MKKVTILLSLFLFISVVSAFGAPRYHFCVVHNNADHPSITAVIQGLNDEAEIYNIKVTHYDPAFDPQKQISMIEDCISLKSDLIVVNAVDPEAVISGLKKAHKAGIPVVMNNADTNDEGRKYTKTYVGAAAVLQGHATGEAMVNTLPNGAKGVVIIGKPGQTDVVLRLQGVREALVKGNRNLEFLDEQPANWMPDQAMTVMQAFLTRYPPGELDFVLALDDPMALGAMQAIKAAGRMNEIKSYGFNGNKQACDAIKNGEMEGTALSLSYLSGVNTIRAGYDVLKGRIVSNQIFSPTQQLIPANIDEWYSQCW